MSKVHLKEGLHTRVVQKKKIMLAVGPISFHLSKSVGSDFISASHQGI